MDRGRQTYTAQTDRGRDWRAMAAADKGLRKTKGQKQGREEIVQVEGRQLLRQAQAGAGIDVRQALRAAWGWQPPEASVVPSLASLAFRPGVPTKRDSSAPNRRDIAYPTGETYPTAYPTGETYPTAYPTGETCTKCHEPHE